MNSQDKKQKILDAIYDTKSCTDSEKNFSKVYNDICKKSSFIFDSNYSDNEIYEYLKSLVKPSLFKVEEQEKRFENMESDNKKEYDDVNGYFYDIKSEQAYINKLLTKLYELDVYKPKKLYPSIFYERYIEKQDMALIAKMHNISQNELNERILEIANYIAKD